jgi:hypothetical protein
MLTPNQLNDVFQQKFGRTATSDEVTKYSGSDISSLQNMQTDPTFANVKGTIYNKNTNTGYSTPDEFAKAAGMQAPPTDWSKFNFDTSYDPTQAATQPYSATSSTEGYQDTYSKALDSTGATAAKQQYDSLTKQINDIDSDIANLVNSKTQAAKASGGVVNSQQITAEAYQEKQTELILRQSLATQQSAAEKQYNDALSQTDKLVTFSQQSKQQAITQVDSLITQISNGSLDISKVDPSQLSQLEQSAGLTAGFLSKLSTSKPVAHAFIQDNNGNTTYVQYDKDGNVITQSLGNIGKSNQYGTSTATGGLSPDSTIQDFFSTYAPKSDGNDPIAYANDVAQQLGIDPSTPITQLAGKESDMANAIATHEGFFNGTAKSAVKDNNPGALNFADQPGATKDGRWAKFPTLSAGFQALVNQIHSYIEKAYGLSSGDYDIANKLANGELGLTAFQRLLGGLSSNPTAMARRTSILNLASTLNSNFNEAEWEQGQKFGANSNTQKTLAAIDAVQQTFSIVKGIASQAINTGIPILNKIVMPGAVAVGNVSTSNFATAAKALADELSGVLGYGSATDMKLQLGIDLADPTQSPEQFSKNLGTIEQLVTNRKNGLQAQIWQGTGNPNNPATSQNAITTPDGLKWTQNSDGSYTQVTQ